jgi:glycine/D-amino acid oxidase-like deaminating enzyme
VSDKRPGPELTLALHSLGLWRAFARRASRPFEFETKGGLVVAPTDVAAAGMRELVRAQQAAGVHARLIEPRELLEIEPLLAPDIAGGVLYDQDCQLQPMRAVLSLLTEAARLGATVVSPADVLGAERDPAGAIRGIRTSRGPVATRRVVVAAGAWSGAVAGSLGGAVPVTPRRGHIIVTEPLPGLIRHKVYEADYLADVESDDSGLRSTAVVEGTDSGPILLGSSREFAGFDSCLNRGALAAIARRAIRLFPFLRDVRAIRAYLGFRPASPDHLPIIGEDTEGSGLWYATGHEGAGIGLAMGTADLIRALVLGQVPPVDPAPFSPARQAIQPAQISGGVRDA